MAFTRAQASALLNQTEMRLFDDSRANALRALDRSDLDSRITRARASRDRARDLLKRQRGAARTRGAAGRDGVAARTARKEALLVEILGRFTEARKSAPAAARKAAATRATTKKAPTKKASTKQASTKQASTKKASTEQAPTKKAATKQAAAERGSGTAAKKAAAKKGAPSGGAATKTAAARSPAKRAPEGPAATKKPATRKASAEQAGTRKVAPKRAATRKSATTKSAPSRGRLTPERALEQTRKLLEAKQERARTPQPWQSLDPSTDHVPEAGFQSPQAAGKARQLHDGEARIPSIHGSNSTRDRINQGKRDHRGDND